MYVEFFELGEQREGTVPTDGRCGRRQNHCSWSDTGRHLWNENYKKWVTWSSDIAGNVAANQRRIVKALHDSQVAILLGTDSPQLFNVPGLSSHREIRAMSEAGMSAYEILRSGTSSAGAYFRDHDRFGVVTQC